MSKRQHRFHEFTVEVSGQVTGTFRLKKKMVADNAEDAGKLLRKQLRGKAIDHLALGVSIGTLTASKVRSESITAKE